MATSCSKAPRSTIQRAAGSAGRVPSHHQIPLDTFEPGNYSLSLEARTSLDANLEVARHVPFTVTAVEPAR